MTKFAFNTVVQLNLKTLQHTWLAQTLTVPLLVVLHLNQKASLLFLTSLNNQETLKHNKWPVFSRSFFVSKKPWKPISKVFFYWRPNNLFTCWMALYLSGRG